MGWGGGVIYAVLVEGCARPIVISAELNETADIQNTPNLENTCECFKQVENTTQ